MKRSALIIFSTLFIIIVGYSALSPDAFISDLSYSSTDPSTDLQIMEVREPDWLDNSTMVFLSIKNTGAAFSDSIYLKISDADLSLDEAKKLKLVNRHNRWMFEENDDIYSGEDTDPYFEFIFPIAGMKKNETMELEFSLGDYWVYDPNCELKFELDVTNLIHETNEENNVAYFFAGG